MSLVNEGHLPGGDGEIGGHQLVVRFDVTTGAPGRLKFPRDPNSSKAATSAHCIGRRRHT